MHHFPRVQTESFKSGYDRITWRNNEAEFKRWCEGRTGYPIVDAGMRSLMRPVLCTTEFSMITASFLAKHPLDRLAMGRGATLARSCWITILRPTTAAGNGCELRAAMPRHTFAYSTRSCRRRSSIRMKPYYTQMGSRIWHGRHYPGPMVDHKTVHASGALNTYNESFAILPALKNYIHLNAHKHYRLA